MCIPYRLLCNGVPECPHGDDELKCTSWECPRMLRCSAENICVHPVEVCDGILHCPISGDDEAFCPKSPCPPQCTCLGRVISCLQMNKIEYNSSAIAILRFADPDTSPSIILNKVWYLDIASNNITSISQLKQLHGPKVIKLNISNNPLSQLNSHKFPLTEIRYLDFDKSMLFSINIVTFNAFKNLVRLKLAYSKIYKIEACSFCDLKNLQIIDLSHSLIEHLAHEVIHEIPSLKIFSFDSPKIKTVSKGLLESNSLLEFRTTHKQLCCLKGSVIISFCKNSTVTMKCPEQYHSISWIFATYFAILLKFNVISFIHVCYNQRNRKHMKSLYVGLIGLIPSVSLLAFHIFNVLNDSSLVIETVPRTTEMCRFIGVTLVFVFFLSNLMTFLFILDLYLILQNTMQKLSSRSKHLERFGKCAIFSLLGIVIGAIFNRPLKSNCLIDYDTLAKTLVLVVHVGMCCMSLILMIVAMQKIAMTRRAAGRAEKQQEKGLKNRLVTLAFTMVTSSVLHILYQSNILKHDTLDLVVLVLYKTLIPLCFPVLFVLSTKKFKDKTRSFFHK